MDKIVIKVGNSLGVTLPKEFVVKNKVKKGSKITVVHSKGSITFSVNKPKKTEYDTVTDKDFLATIQEVELQYGTALDKLANL